MIQVIPSSLRDFFWQPSGLGKMSLWFISLSVNDVKGQSQSMASNSNSFKAKFLGLEWKSDRALDCRANATTCQLRKDHCYCVEGELISSPLNLSQSPSHILDVGTVQYKPLETSLSASLPALAGAVAQVVRVHGPLHSTPLRATISIRCDVYTAWQRAAHIPGATQSSTTSCRYRDGLHFNECWRKHIFPSSTQSSLKSLSFGTNPSVPTSHDV